MDIIARDISGPCLGCLFTMVCSEVIPVDEFGNLFKSTIKQSYKRGEIILKQGMKSNHLVYLLEGIVKFNYVDESDRSLILSVSKGPTLLGLANILNEDVNIFSVVVLEDCKGCLIDLEKMKILLFDNHFFMLNILKMSTGLFRDSIFNFISLAHKQVNGRVADILIYLSKNIYMANTFALSLSRQEMADFAGCSKENVIHSLRNFHADGVVKVSGKKIEIVDLERLRKISQSG